MRLRNPGLWIALLSGCAVVGFVVMDSDRASPGPVTAVHARVPDLNGGRSCSQCHGGWWSDMQDSCLDCHQPIAEQIDGDEGLHGAIGGDRVALCALCHGEHHGPSFSIVNAQSFALAGVPDRDAFDHGMVGFDMSGQHLSLECSDCHVNAEVSLLPEGQPRFLGLEQNCATCHGDPHEGRYVLQCVDCHGQESFDQLAAVNHDRHLPLLGGHEAVACSECHQPTTDRSLDTLGQGGVLAPRGCLDCHTSPHARGFLENAGQRLGVAPKASCGVCHEPTHTAFDDPELTITPELHACSGFSLEAPHDTAECSDCHRVGEDLTFAVRYPGRDADDCSQCHEDPHAGQFDGSASGADGCLGCHDRHQFEPHTFSFEKHRQTAFALTGSHVELDCESCHKVPAEGDPRSFHGTPLLCEACHADAHFGFFDQFAHELGAEHGQCEHCHYTTDFADVPEGGFDHSHWTGFPVQGSHAQTQCESCHPRSLEPDETGRSFGRVVEHFGKFTGCVTCHADPHRGAFDRPELPRSVEGRAGCARCHDEVTFRSVADRFDHLAWTGFPLQGAHETVGCAACHEPMPEPDIYGRTWARARGVQCADCHADPHAGQFDVAGRTDCARCHRVGAGFTDLSFNHEIQSRFRLGEAHSEVACAKCHVPVHIGDVEVVRYRPMGTECVYCHGEQVDPLRRNRGRGR